MSIYTDTISENLRRALRRAGMTQAELAEKLDLSRTSVGLYCRGQLLPTIDVLDQIAAILGIPTYTLMMTDKDMSNLELGQSIAGSGLSHDVTLLRDLHTTAPKTYDAVALLLTRLTD